MFGNVLTRSCGSTRRQEQARHRQVYLMGIPAALLVLNSELFGSAP
jgi:hypothetical protein